MASSGVNSPSQNKKVYRHLSKKHGLKKQIGWQPSSPLGETREKGGGDFTVKFKHKIWVLVNNNQMFLPQL